MDIKTPEFQVVEVPASPDVCERRSKRKLVERELALDKEYLKVHQRHSNKIRRQDSMTCIQDSIPLKKNLPSGNYYKERCALETCQRPTEKSLWVQCEECLLWYHAQCIHQTAEEIKKFDVYYCCRYSRRLFPIEERDLMDPYAFFWLLSLLISSLWWYMIYPLKDVLVFGLVFSVLFQELFRYIVYLILRKAEGGLKKVTDGNTQLVDNKHILAYVSGLGFGIMSGAFALINVLADSVGPGTVGLRKDGDSPLFVVTSALTTLCFILLNTTWGVIFFHALDSKKYILLLYVIATHLTASLLTLLNTRNLYWATVLPNFIILLLTSWIAFRSAGGRNPREIMRGSQPTAAPTTVPVEVAS